VKVTFKSGTITKKKIISTILLKLTSPRESRKLEAKKRQRLEVNTTRKSTSSTLALPSLKMEANFLSAAQTV